jgi:hypothetical protein
MSAPSVLSENVKTLAKNLTQTPPRSPRDTSIAGYILAARILDKCRAELSGQIGEYRCLDNSRLDGMFLTATGIQADEFRALVSTGASDIEVAEWIKAHSKLTSPEELAQWNNTIRSLTLAKLPIEIQMQMEDYVPQYVPEGKIVRVLIDIFDFEEGYL